MKITKDMTSLIINFGIKMEQKCESVHDITRRLEFWEESLDSEFSAYILSMKNLIEK
jgi:hypothetical protein